MRKAEALGKGDRCLESRGATTCGNVTCRRCAACFCLIAATRRDIPLVHKLAANFRDVVLLDLLTALDARLLRSSWLVIRIQFRFRGCDVVVEFENRLTSL